MTLSAASAAATVATVAMAEAFADDETVAAPALPLRRLGLAQTSVSDAGCMALHALAPTLTALDLSFNPAIRNAAFLAHLPNLVELDLSLNGWVDDVAVSVLAASMPRLRRLVLEKTETADDGLAALAPLAPSLTYLDLSRTAVCPAARLSAERVPKMPSRALTSLHHTPRILMASSRGGN